MVGALSTSLALTLVTPRVVILERSDKRGHAKGGHHIEHQIKSFVENTRELVGVFSQRSL